MADWGLCATVKAPASQVGAFVAYHLAAGAAHIWLHYDDPAQANEAPRHPQVTAVACDDVYWAAFKGARPDRHQNRQALNARRVYGLTRLPWLGHWDVDEFVQSETPLSVVLDQTPADDPMLRLSPYEALSDPGLRDDIFTARAFRGAMKGPAAEALRQLAFGRYAPLLPDGVLSHSAGKCLFRTGIPGLQPRLHGAFRNGERIKGPEFTQAAAVLHFHAQNRAAWLEQLHFRITRGAYQYNPALAGFLSRASSDEVAAFYDRVQVAQPDVLAALREGGALIELDLNLRETMHRVLGEG